MCTDTLVEGGAHCWGGSSSYYSTSSPRPLPRHIQFSYILCAAYHVIVETYAHKCADMCKGPGSTGRVRDTRCTSKNTINSSAPFLFSLFSSAFASRLLPLFFVFWRTAPHFSHLRAICNQTRWSRPSFLKILFPRCHFLSDSLLHSCLLNAGAAV